MPTNRTRINRQPVERITPEAIKLFEAMERLECTCPPRDWEGEYWKHTPCRGCDRWWELHSRLYHLLGCKPWQWPCVEHPAAVPGYPEGSLAALAWNPDLGARARWKALDRAAREARRAKREAKRAVLRAPG
jgi:hypothetical protein